MNDIKFSHEYKKLLDEQRMPVEEAVLLDVWVKDIAELSVYFLNYDTDDGIYELPKHGKFMILVLLKPRKDFGSPKHLFTTLRRWTANKEQYYRGLIGEKIKIGLPAKEKK